MNIDGDGTVAVEGPKGKLNWTSAAEHQGKRGRTIEVSFVREAETRSVKALHGLSRALVNNMVRRRERRFTKQLEIEGVGFKAAVQGSEPESEPRIFASNSLPDSARTSRSR